MRAIDARPSPDHVVHFFERDAELAEVVARYVGAALDAGGVGVLVATRRHVRAIESALAARSSGGGGQAGRRLVTIDAEAALARVVPDDVVDHDQFDDIVRVVRAAAAPGAPLVVFGELVDLLWRRGNVAAAMELERSWDRNAAEVPFTLLCAYRVEGGRSADFLDDLGDVCRCHAAVVDHHLEPVPPADAVTALRVSRSFPATHHAARLARRFVVDVLTGWERDRRLDDAALVVSELATNAIVHARSGFGVAVVSSPHGVRISVRDGADARPALRTPSHTDPDGRGLAVVEHLSARWGSEAVGGGKIVWAELDDGGPPPPDPPGSR